MGGSLGNARAGAAVRSAASRLPLKALGALAGQVTLALGSFALQVVASRELGPAQFGTFALLFGAIVMGTGLTTGLLGDSLTVLDRKDPAIRTALIRLGWVVILVLALGGFGLGLLQYPIGTAALFAAALAAFAAADLGRRLLMANLRFWRLVVVDSVGAAAMLGFLFAMGMAGPLGLNHFLAALSIGQLVAGLVVPTLLPRRPRSSVRKGRRHRQGWGNWRAVLGYGSWRAVQQFIRPTTLNAARWTVLAIAGAAAVGELEAARLFVAPAMLLVQGFGSYLFSSYAAGRAEGTGNLLRRADRAARIMLGGSVLVGVAAGFLVPHVGPLLTAGAYQLSLAAVLGWACYAASCAAVLPYGSLAAVQGKQHWVLLIRVVDSLLGLALVVTLLAGTGLDPDWMPWILSTGSFVGGLLCRNLLLKPGVRDAARPVTETDSSSLALEQDPRRVGRNAL